LISSRKLVRYDANLATTPIDPNLKLKTEDDELLEDINLFQRLVENLIYLTVTRPEHHI
jgi:hypothetical protein